MKSQWLRMFMGGLLICLLAVASASAGQVVTERERNWARQALAREAALDTAQMPDNTLSVLYFSNSTGQPALDALRKGLAFMLMTDLSKIDGLVLVERQKLQALVEEMGLGVSGLVEAGSAPRVGRLLGARFLVIGDISGGVGAGALGGAMDEAAVSRTLETLIRILPGALNVTDLQAESLSPVEGPVGNLFQMEKMILFAIVEHFEIVLSEDKKAALRVPATTNGRALYYFFLGLTYGDMRRFKLAGAFYEKALKEDPSLLWARDALDELGQRGLYGSPRAIKPILRSLRNRTSLTDSVAPDDVVRRVRSPYDVELHQRLRPRPQEEMDFDGDGFSPAQGDCNDNDPAIYPGASEICGDGIDQDCNGSDLACETPVDADADGYSVAQGDCDDTDASVYPGASETCGDGIDQDCSGADLPCILADVDRDGYTPIAGDCNDNDPTVYPGAYEQCDRKDNDCNGLVDDNPQCE